MNMDEAQKLVATAPVPDISQHRQALADRYPGSPQLAMACDLAMRQIEEGIGVLARHGHRYSLVQMPATAGEQFPTMVYQDNQAPLIVNSQAELDSALVSGWRTTPNAEQEPSPAQLRSDEPEPVRTEDVGGIGQEANANSSGEGVSASGQTGQEPASAAL